MADRGLKRLCGSCGTKFYDFGKLPIICPSCTTQFTGDVVIKTRRTKSSIVADTVKRADIEEKNRDALDDEDEDDADTISLDDLDEGDDDLDIDAIDDADDEDDLSDLEGDVDIDLDDDLDR